MTVTELALLSLLPPATIQDKFLLESLALAKNVLETWTGRAFHFFSQIEDPAFVYVIGEWEDVRQHREIFIPSEINRQLLELLKGQISVQWLFHINIEQEKLPLSAPIISINHYSISPGREEAYTRTLETVSHHLNTYVAPSHLAHGWRLDKEEDGNEEDVHITGWESVARHHEFAQTDGFKEFARIREFMDHADFKHAKRLDL